MNRLNLNEDSHFNTCQTCLNSSPLNLAGIRTHSLAHNGKEAGKMLHCFHES